MKTETETIIQGLFIIAIIFLLLNWIYLPYIKDYNTDRQYKKVIDKNIDDEYTEYYSNLCKGREQEIDCVMTSTKTIYKYTRDQNRTTIRTPSQYTKMGGNCKDSAIFYATIFKRMNYTIDFQFPIPNHVIIIISKQLTNNIYKYCNIEGNTATCYEVTT